MGKMQTQGLQGLAQLRKRAGFTQEGLAAALGIDRGRLSNWETGAIWPSAGWLPKLADLLNCTIDDLYEPQPQLKRSPRAESSTAAIIPRAEG